MTIAELIAKYNTAGTGLFKTGQSRGIGSDDMREFVVDITTLSDLPVSAAYIPLGGAADFTNDVTVDGNGYILDFTNLGGFALDVGLNNMAFTGDVLSLESTNAINWGVDDGVDQTDVDIDAVSFVISTVDTHFNNTNSFNASANDGVDSSSFSLTPTAAIFDSPIQLASYTVGTAPDPTLFDGCLIYITNEGGGKVPAWSNGVTWNRVYDGNPISV